MVNQDLYWATMATLMPVVAFAFFLEIRFLQWDKYSYPRRRWAGALYGLLAAGMILTEVISLNFLNGRPQADWSREAALWVCIVALGVVVVHPLAFLKQIAEPIALEETYRSARIKVREVLNAVAKSIDPLRVEVASREREVNESIDRMSRLQRPKGEWSTAHSAYLADAQRLQTELAQRQVAHVDAQVALLTAEVEYENLKSRLNEQLSQIKEGSEDALRELLEDARKRGGNSGN